MSTVSPTEYTLAIGDVATALNLTAGQVRRLDDELQPIRIGRQRRYKATDVSRAMRARAVFRVGPGARFEIASPGGVMRGATHALSTEAREQLATAARSLIQARSNQASLAIKMAKSVQKLLTVASRIVTIDRKTQRIVDAYMQACLRFRELDRKRRRSRLLLLDDREVKDAAAKIERFEPAIDRCVEHIRAKVRALGRRIRKESESAAGEAEREREADKEKQAIAREVRSWHASALTFLRGLNVSMRLRQRG